MRVYLNQALQIGVRVYLCAQHIFTNITFALLADEPSSSVYILELNILAWIRLIAAQHYGEQKTISNTNIFQFHIGDVDSWLCLTVTLRIERVKHTSRASLVWLFLLLWAEIDRPPNGFMHCDIFIKDVINDAVAIVAGIGFEIDAFKRFLHYCISEGNVSDTVYLWIWWDSANSKANSQSNRNILDQHILSAIHIAIVVSMSGFWHNYVIIVLASDVVNVEIPTVGIDAIGIERKHWHCSYQIKSLKDVQLRSCIYFNIQIVNNHIDRLVDFEMKAW